jgi:hypothetical protein
MVAKETETLYLRFDCSFWKLWSLVDGRTNIIAFLAL